MVFDICSHTNTVPISILDVISRYTALIPPSYRSNPCQMKWYSSSSLGYYIWMKLVSISPMSLILYLSRCRSLELEVGSEDQHDARALDSCREHLRHIRRGAQGGQARLIISAEGGYYVWNMSRSSDKRVKTRALDPTSPDIPLLIRMGLDPTARAPCTSSGESPT